MSIVSKPTTRAYASNWNRIFKKKWGVVVGKPTRENHGRNDPTLQDRIGFWCRSSVPADMGAPALFNTRAEARQEAKRWAAGNRFWHFHAKKYDGHA